MPLETQADNDYMSSPFSPEYKNEVKKLLNTPPHSVDCNTLVHDHFISVNVMNIPTNTKNLTGEMLNEYFLAPTI